MESDIIARALVTQATNGVNIQHAMLRSALSAANQPAWTRVSNVDGTEQRFRGYAAPCCWRASEFRPIAVEYFLIFERGHQTDMRHRPVWRKHLGCIPDALRQDHPPQIRGLADYVPCIDAPFRWHFVVEKVSE